MADPQFIPVDHDPFASSGNPPPSSVALVPVDYDPFQNKQTDYTGWDVPGTSTVPGMPGADAAVPFKREPGYYYGSVIPFRIKQDATGKDIPGTQQLAAPEAIAAPARGVIEGGQAALGERSMEDPKVRADIAAAVAFGATPAKVSPIRSVTEPTTGIDALNEFVARIKGVDISNDPAAQKIVARMRQDTKAGGPTAQDMLDLLNINPTKPLTLGDVGGENVLALTGRVARAPGESRQIIKGWLDKRDLGAGPRLYNDITQALGDEGGNNAFKALVKARSKAARPLFDKAYEGGSIAPLERQFEVEFDKASAAEKQAAQAVSDALSQLTAAQSKKPVTGGNVYAESAANDAVRTADRQVQQARANLTRVREVKEQILERLRDAQDDIATGKPGAVWNPRIQEFLDNPRVKQGIRRGWRIERDEALAEGRPINASDYAIVGEDAEGEPIVGKVPTMRLLAVAKEGLDRILQGDEFRSSLTGELNKEGVAIDKVRAEFLKELDAANPDYKVARDQWAGDSQSLEAFQLGEKLFKTNPREINDRVAEMTNNDKQFLRLGAARLLHDEVAKKGITGDEAKAIIRSQHTRDQLRPIFDTDQQYERFINSVEAEGRMFGTRYSVLGNSRTASREVEDRSPELDAFAQGARAILRGAANHWGAAVGHAWEMIKAIGRAGDPAVNAEMAKVLSTDLSQADTQARMTALKQLLDAAAPVDGKVQYGNVPPGMMGPSAAALAGAVNGQGQQTQ